MAKVPVEIGIHLWSLQPLAEAMAGYARFLSNDEVARADRFVYPKHRIQFVATRGRLREIMGSLTGIKPEEVKFEYGPQGKPSLIFGPQFNLSHSGGVACLAVHDEIPLGVDIEAFREVESGVSQRFFSATEYTTLMAMPIGDQVSGFFRCWTRKEAVIKALGGGLSIPLNAFDVTLEAKQPPLMTRLDQTYGEVSNWTLGHMTLGPTLMGAIAAKTFGGPIELRLDSNPDNIPFESA